MARKKKEEVIVVDIATFEKASNRLKKNNDLEAFNKEVEIKSAILKDDFCNYSYELKSGITAGDELSRSGASIVHDDLKERFAQLNAHIAYMDMAYDMAKQDVIDIDDCHNNEIASMYYATGFKLSGNGENESVILTGIKHVKYGSIDIKTPKLPFDSSYPFANELRVAIDDCIAEVDAYMHGKTAPKMVQNEINFDDDVES
jgi:hypothetical protein